MRIEYEVIPFNKESLALKISREMFNEKRSIESFNAYQCVRDYLFDLSMKELIILAREYNVKIYNSNDNQIEY